MDEEIRFPPRNVPLLMDGFTYTQSSKKIVQGDLIVISIDGRYFTAICMYEMDDEYIGARSNDLVFEELERKHCRKLTFTIPLTITIPEVYN